MRKDVAAHVDHAVWQRGLAAAMLCGAGSSRMAARISASLLEAEVPQSGARGVYPGAGCSSVPCWHLHDLEATFVVFGRDLTTPST